MQQDVMEKSVVKASSRHIDGEITLTAGKSESNRVLLIKALCEEDFKIENLAAAKDTETMISLLDDQGKVKDVGPAGTTMRFLTAYYANTPGEYLLTGSERMKNRPIKILVDALKELGAEISYTGIDGCPPLEIKGKKLAGGILKIDGSVSSQYLSALMLIAPTLEGGLKLELQGKIASVPYLQMTLNLIKDFGIEGSFEGNVIEIKEGAYKAKSHVVEADWSSASYWYQIISFSQNGKLQINGLREKSLQGDSAIVDIYGKLGVKSTFNDKGVLIEKDNDFALPDVLEWDFSNCPDVAQTLASTVAALGVEGRFTGLESLRIKETDRIEAIKKELLKFNIEVSILSDEEIIVHRGSLEYSGGEIETYDDHRVAMSIAPLALTIDQELTILEPNVVVKSYPDYWKDLSAFGIVSRNI